MTYFSPLIYPFSHLSNSGMKEKVKTSTIPLSVILISGITAKLRKDKAMNGDLSWQPSFFNAFLTPSISVVSE